MVSHRGVFNRVIHRFCGSVENAGISADSEAMTGHLFISFFYDFRGRVRVVDGPGNLCFYAFMRTTVELPPELMRQAKAHAASRGESLKTLLTRAVSVELGKSANPQSTAGRVSVPLFGNPKGTPVVVSSEDIARAFAEDDVSTARRVPRLRRR